MDISKASSLGDVGEVEGGLEITLDLPAMKAELTRVQAKCAIRGLVQVNLPSSLNFWLKSAWIHTFVYEIVGNVVEKVDYLVSNVTHVNPQTSKWLAEMNYALKDTPLPDATPTEPPEIPPGPDLDTFTLAKSYFDLKEFDRAAFFARKLTSNLGRFLHLYARFMSAEKKRMDDLTDSVVSPDSAQLSQLRQLRVELQQLHADGHLDAYGLYVYGIVLRKLSLPDLATPVLCEAVRGEPGHWGAWLELSCLVTSRDKLASLQLPDHWCKQVN